MKPEAAKIRVLVLCGDKWHPAEVVRQGLAPLSDGIFDFQFLEANNTWPETEAEKCQLIILAKANMISSVDEHEWLTAKSQDAFAQFVRRGGGLLVIHGGSSRYEQLPVVNAIIGGAFISHPEQCPVTLEPVHRHPLAAGITPFTVRDEHYFMAMSDPDAEVALHSRSEHGIQPAAWTRTEGGGRVGVLAPGHNLEVWRHPEFQKLLLNALRWTVKLN